MKPAEWDQIAQIGTDVATGAAVLIARQNIYADGGGNESHGTANSALHTFIPRCTHDASTVDLINRTTQLLCRRPEFNKSTCTAKIIPAGLRLARERSCVRAAVYYYSYPVPLLFCLRLNKKALIHPPMHTTLENIKCMDLYRE